MDSNEVEVADNLNASESKRRRRRGKGAVKDTTTQIEPGKSRPETAKGSRAPGKPSKPKAGERKDHSGTPEVVQHATDEQYRALYDKLREQKNLIRSLTSNNSSSESSVIDKSPQKNLKRAQQPAKGKNRSQAPSPQQPPKSDCKEKCSGGMIHLSKKDMEKLDRSAQSTLVRPVASTRTAREGVDFPKKKKVTPEILATLRADFEVSRTKDSWAEVSSRRVAEADVASVAKYESAAQTSLEIVRNSKASATEASVLGLSVGLSAELYKPIHKLEQVYLEQLSKSLLHCIAAATVGIPFRFWIIRKKQLEIFQLSLSSSSPMYVSDDSKRPLVLACYADEIQRTKQLLSGACADIERWLTDASQLTTEDDRVLREGICHLLIGMGDAHRYGDVLERKKRRVASQTSLAEPEFQRYFRLARTFAPWVGAVYKSLAHFPRYNSQLTQCIFQALRSLSAQSAVLEREALMEGLEIARKSSEQLSAVSVLSGLTFDEQRHRFESHFLASLSIAFTRIDADTFENHADKCKRHVAIAMQMLSTDVVTMLKLNSGKSSDVPAVNSSGKFEVVKSASKAPSNFVELLSSIIVENDGNKSLENSLKSFEFQIFQTVQMAINTIHLIATKFCLVPSKEVIKTASMMAFDGMEEESQLTEQLNSEGVVSSAEAIGERTTLLVKRLSVLRLQRIQRVPGLVDMMKLLMSLLCTLMGSSSSATAMSMLLSGDSTHASMLVLLGLRSLVIAVEWIQTNPWLHLLKLIIPSDWLEFERCLCEYLKVLPRADIADETKLCLPEDIDLAGLAPFASGVNDRYESYYRHLLPTLLSQQRSDIDGAHSSVFVAQDLQQRSTRLRLSVMSLTDQQISVSTELTNLIVFDSQVQPPCASLAVALPNEHVLCAFTQQRVSQLVIKEASPKLNSSNNNGLGDESSDDVGNDVSSDITDEDFSGSRAAASEGDLDLTSTAGVLRIAGLSINSSTKSKEGNRAAVERQTQSRKELAFGRGGVASGATLPLIVVDAANVAMRHGLNAKFSCKGIQIVLQFFKLAGHRVLCFLPDYYLSFEEVAKRRTEARLNLKDHNLAARIPDDVSLLLELVKQGFVIGTPSFDYDDDYCLRYARKHNGYIVTNDLFRDHLQKMSNPGAKKETRLWLKEHCISYTFVGDEFLPNPDFEFK